MHTHTYSCLPTKSVWRVGVWWIGWKKPSNHKIWFYCDWNGLWSKNWVSTALHRGCWDSNNTCVIAVNRSVKVITFPCKLYNISIQFIRHAVYYSGGKALNGCHPLQPAPTTHLTSALLSINIHTLQIFGINPGYFLASIVSRLPNLWNDQGAWGQGRKDWGAWRQGYSYFLKFKNIMATLLEAYRLSVGPIGWLQLDCVVIQLSYSAVEVSDGQPASYCWLQSVTEPQNWEADRASILLMNTVNTAWIAMIILHAYMSMRD
jgi:hypothetical protein